MRRAQTFLRRVGIEISFEREGRARIRTIVTSNAMSEQTSENTWARASASSASPAPGTKANTINDFPALQLRTVSGAADGSTNGIGHDHPSIVRSNSLKTNLPPDADGEDANSPPQSAQEKNCLERTDMNAVQALEAARAAGITIALDGDDLMLQASAQPPEDVLELLSHHKPGIVVLLRPDRSWTAEDWRALYDERAGIAEIDGGYRAVRRKRRPSSSCVIEWLSRNHDCSLPGRCVGWGGAQVSGHPVVPFGVEPGSHAWLHAKCWAAWHARRKAMAVAALASMGIEAPADPPGGLGGNGENIMVHQEEANS